MSDSYVTTFEMDVQGDSEMSCKLDQLAGKIKNVWDKGKLQLSKLASTGLDLNLPRTTAIIEEVTRWYFGWRLMHFRY
jgi:hypothetical protein